MTPHDDKPSSLQAIADAAKRRLKPSGTEWSVSTASKSAGPAHRRRILNRFFEHPSNRPTIVLAAMFLAIYAALALAVPFEPVVRSLTVPFWSKNALTFLLTVAATLWGVSAYFRCSDAVIKRYICIIATLIVAWSIVSILKHITQDDYIESLFWYAYYLPIMLVPTFMLFCALHIVVPDDRPTAIIMKRFCVAVSLVLGVLVLTNNVHQLAFEFSFDNEQWRHQHSYGPVYFAVFGWIAVQGISFICLLLAASRRQLRNVLAFVAGIVLIGMTYSVLYNLRIEPAYTTPLTLVFSLFYLAIMDLCLRTGLFPSCSDYLQVFYELPLDVKLRSIDKSQMEQTNMAKPPRIDLFAKALDALQRQEEPANFKLPNSPDEVFSAYSILGGAAVVSRDIATLNQRKRDLEKQQTMLRRQNALLNQYRAAQTQLYRKRSENELFQNVETSLAEAVATINELLDGLGPQSDRMSWEEKREQRLVLMKVKLLVSYCKRKGGLVLIEYKNADFERSRLNLMINETLSDLRPVGIDCAALIETDDVLPASTTSVCCDCLYAFSLAALNCEDPTIMLCLQNKNGSFVELRIVLEDEKTEDIAHGKAMRRLEESLEASEASFTLSCDDGVISLSALMPRRR